MKKTKENERRANSNKEGMKKKEGKIKWEKIKETAVENLRRYQVKIERQKKCLKEAKILESRKNND